MKRNRGYTLIEIVIALGIIVFLISFLAKNTVLTRKYINMQLQQDNRQIKVRDLEQTVQAEFAKAFALHEVLTAEGRILHNIGEEEIQVKCIQLFQKEMTDQKMVGETMLPLKIEEYRKFIYIMPSEERKPLRFSKKRGDAYATCETALYGENYEAGTGIEEMTIRKISDTDFEVGFSLYNENSDEKTKRNYFMVKLCR